MKILIVIALFAISTFVEAQRGSYAGSGPIGYPGLHSRFKDENEDTSSTSNTNLANRIGEVSSERIPIDARGDHDLVNRLNSWPRENRPFWLINAEAIEAQRNQRPQFPIQTQSRFGEDQNLNVIPARPAHQRPSFAGPPPF